MNPTIAEKWCLFRASDDVVKVMASWSGSYPYGASWRTNSGIESAEETEDAWLITGYSGSVYECKKNAYGIHWYAAGILKSNDRERMTEDDALAVIRSLRDNDLLDMEQLKGDK